GWMVVWEGNHHWRGRLSDGDAQFVKRLVERYNQERARQALLPGSNWAKAGRLPGGQTGKRSARLTTTGRIESELGSANIRALAKKQKMSIETAAREARYAFFAETARRRNCR